MTTRERKNSWAGRACLALLGVVLALGPACQNDEQPETKDEVEKPARRNPPVRDALLGDDDLPNGGPPPPAPIASQAEDPNDPRKLVYLVSRDDELYSFNPRVPGRAAYRLVGKMDCKAAGRPQTMAVDRTGWAWVFFDTGQLFKVSIRDASCSSALPYKHPTYNRQLGMGFTAVAPGSPEERLFIMSPDHRVGLATINPGLDVSGSGKLAGGAELTGGGDGKLFHYAAWQQQLSEVDLSTYTLRPMHTFTTLSNVQAWAFARYAGRFYLFTSDLNSNSKTTEFDPRTKAERLRDANIGFVVVGAGQSTLVPPSDSGPDISDDFP